MFKYYVVVDDPAFRDEIHESLHADHNCECEFIPDRAVHCHDPMHGSEYNGIFMLTDEEAEKLKEDPRVRDVHRIPEEIGIEKRHHGSRSGSFDKSSSVSSSMRNWALNRCINKIENYGVASTTSTPYTFNLDGEGVDVIISDTGVLPNHPELAVNEDGTGGSRVVDHDWSQYGFLTTPTGGWLGDCDGHGTNVAGIIAGNRNGWAPKAAIYSLRCIGDGSGGPYHDMADGRTLTLLNSIDTWKTIKAFHLAKPITSTGYRRPTIVNASWGSIGSYPTAANTASVGVMYATIWRDITYSTTGTTSTYGMIDAAAGGDGTRPYRSSAEDAEISSMLTAGVIMTSSAGNNRHKMDVSTGMDYSNRFVTTFGVGYYHRGQTPAAVPGVICVGATSYTLPEHKANYSHTGPRVDIFCPGTYIMGPWTGSNYTSIIRDPRNSNYWLDKVSGTSQAAPQVAGVAALIAQARPWLTSTGILNLLNSVSAKNVLDETYYANPTTSTYTSFGNLQGAANQILYMPFNQDVSMNISSGVSTWDVTFTGTTISGFASASNLGNRLSGGSVAVATYSTWTFSGSNITMTASGIPYHSFWSGAAANVPYVQSYNKTWTYRGGTNTTGTQATLGGGAIGYWLNGVVAFNPSAQGGAPGGYTTFPNWHYNAAYEAGEDYGYSFGEDLAGGHPAPQGVGLGSYHYHDGSMIVTGAWTNGTGHESGIYGVTGLPESSVIPYLRGGLVRSDGHSKIMAISADGYPIYGPYGYATGNNAASGVRRMVPGYALNPTFVANNARTTNGTTPPVTVQYPLGMFVEDWLYVGGGDLDIHNGRYCVTPEYPAGTYAYFLAFDAENRPTYPYVIGNTYYSTPASI